METIRNELPEARITKHEYNGHHWLCARVAHKTVVVELDEICGGYAHAMELRYELERNLIKPKI